MSRIEEFAEQLRGWVSEELAEMRAFDESQEGAAVSKDEIRQLHSKQRIEALESERAFVYDWQAQVLPRFADGSDVDPAAIWPQIIPVESEADAALFRYATLQWSVPVSRGYGRRTRFLIVDKQNDCLIGIFALGDPVYNLTARDSVIGWDSNQRKERLYNVLDAFVLGALPPYRQLLGGKLVALLAVTNETREIIRAKYQGQKTNIQGRVKEPRPVLITTTSALGRSSIYNRLKYGDSLVFNSVGYTRGFGHFQFSDALFRALMHFLDLTDDRPGYRFGQGPNWRIRTLRVALTKLGLNPNLIRHGIKREVFLAPVASNWVQFLRGETSRIKWLDYPIEDVTDFFVTRWAIPRAERDESYRSVRRFAMALAPRDQQSLF